MKKRVATLYAETGCFIATLIVIGFLLLALAIVFGVYCLEGWIFMALWNWLAVDYFSAVTIGYWASVGLVFSINFIGSMFYGCRVKIQE